jgi:hypothetical protein
MSKKLDYIFGFAYCNTIGNVHVASPKQVPELYVGIIAKPPVLQK